MNSVRAENAIELNRKMQEIMKEKNNETLIGSNFIIIICDNHYM